ncbi:MAG: hypothetical protein GX575_07115 [Candidatus Anammoximicrobium sp.]|nr:hypothetical protein [Candidatus Anammoximicrobium sp.]
MSPINEVLAIVSILAIHLSGLASVVAARLAERSSVTSSAPKWFFVLLGAVGLSTMITLSAGHGIWLLGAATLSLMSLGATIDFRAGRRNPAPLS